MGVFPPQLRRSAAVLAALILVASAACGGDAGTNPRSDAIEGTYSLRTVGGSPLPLTIQTGTSSYTLSSDVLTITRDGTWLEAMTQTATVDGQTTTSTDTNGGTWTRTGSSVSFRSSIDNTTSYTGTYNKGTLTLNDMGIVLVFVR